MPEVLIALVLGVVEGLTEFLPVSSTGHLIIVGHLLGFQGAKAETFEVVIQLGAILAVVALYRERLAALCTLRPGSGFAGRGGWGLLAITTLPALAAGAAAHGVIKVRLFDPTTVAVALALGGVAILAVERFRPPPRTVGLDELGWREGLLVGLFQCLALWPGVSRSAATIGGGMLVGVERRTAAEYSFLAAIPLIGAAAVFELYSSVDLLTPADIPTFAAGFVASFVSAWFAISGFVRLLGRMTLRPFAWYRIGLGLLLLVIEALRRGDL